MKLKFPYGINDSLYILLSIQSPKGLIPFSFLFDTGADLTSLPISAAEKLGIDIDKCPEESMTGYEGTAVLVYRSQVKVYFGKNSFEIPCVFNPNEEVPILLGRAGIIDRFNITLDGKRKQIVFEEINLI